MAGMFQTEAFWVVTHHNPEVLNFPKESEVSLSVLYFACPFPSIQSYHMYNWSCHRICRLLYQSIYVSLEYIVLK